MGYNKSDKTHELEKRIEIIENVLNLPHKIENVKTETIISAPSVHTSEMSSSREHINHKEKEAPKMPSMTFNQVITFLGVAGIIIGMIFFFFYAVAHNWIGEAGQVAIGVTLGFLMFALAYSFKEKKEFWSYIVFGGAYFIEYLSIGVGVHEYEVLPPFVGVFLTLIFLISSLMLTIKFSSRAIGYFSLIGGYLIPFITDTFNNDLFTLVFMFAITVALVIVSSKYNWADLRGVSFFIMTIFIITSSYKFRTATSHTIPVLFLISIYLLYNISSVIYSLRNSKNINIADSIILFFLPLVILPNLYSILDIDMIPFGFIILINAFIYLAEIAIFKAINEEAAKTLKYSILTAGFTMLNFGLFFILKEISEDIFMVIFMIQWLLFGYFSKITKDNEFYNIVSFLFLFLISMWYLFILRFDEGILHASIFMLVLASIPAGFLFLNKQNINKDINGALFIVSIFAYIFSLSTYLVFFINSRAAIQIVLSLMWLVYTLGLLIFLELSKNGRMLVIGLLSITLLKIAFNDMFYLDGAFRIIGFMLFGVLLMVGGFFIKNEKHE